jgi:Zn-dependent peptidase ImmA (M78 family)
MDYPDFFSPFKKENKGGYYKLQSILARNINFFNTNDIDSKIVNYFYKINCSITNEPPFDAIKFAEKFKIKTTFDETIFYASLHPPDSFYNKNPFYRASVNNNLLESEKLISVAHETAHRLMEYNEKDEKQIPTNPVFFDGENLEYTCEKIAREIVIPTPSIKHYSKRIDNNNVSLRNSKELAGIYKVSTSQMLIKLVDDLNIWDAVLHVDKGVCREKTYGNKRIFIDEGQSFPICEFGCYECSKKRKNMEEEIISEKFEKLRLNKEDVKGIVKESWIEKPLPDKKHSYWLAYRE